jgi:hypothetical protein
LRAWSSALTTIAACGGVGAFIDFYIGRRGQQRVRDWLETWWLKFSDVKWGNLGREEALFAARLIDRLCGSRIFSVRRLISTVILTVSSIVIVVGIFMLNGYSLREMFIISYKNDEVPLLALIMTIFTIPISFSITKIISVNIALMTVKWPRSNIIGLIILFVTQYFMLRYWSLFVVVYHDVMGLALVNFNNAVLSIKSAFFREEIYAILENRYDLIDFLPNVSFMIGFLPNLMRLCITVIFIGSFFLKTIQSPIMTLWAHIVESEKPIFTLLFGGSAAFAKLIQEIARNLG